MNVPCGHCGKTLDRPPCRVKANQQFCDHACHTAFQQRRRVEVACVICGKTKSVPPSTAARTESPVCSPACERKRISQMRIEHFGSAETRLATCAQCGKEFTRKPSQLAKYRETFCSRACSAAFKRGKVPPGQQNGHWIPCEACGKDVWRTPGTEQPHTFCSVACHNRSGFPRHRPGPGLFGPRNPWWKGGRSGYAPGFTNAVKRRIRERDGNACRVCGLPWKPKSGNLLIHHVDERKFNHDDTNLITLCRSCHLLVHAQKIRLVA